MEVKKIYKPGDEVIAGGFRFRYNERGFPVSVGRVAPLAAAATTAAAAPKKKKYKVRRAVDSAIAQRDGEAEAARKADEIIAEARRMGAEVDALIGEMDEILAIQEPVKESAADIVFGIPELSRQIFGFKKEMFRAQMFEEQVKMLREEQLFDATDNWDDRAPYQFAGDVFYKIQKNKKVPGSVKEEIFGYNYYGGEGTGAATFAEEADVAVAQIADREVPVEFEIKVVDKKRDSYDHRGKTFKEWIAIFNRNDYDIVAERLEEEYEENKRMKEESGEEYDEEDIINEVLPSSIYMYDYNVSWKTEEGRQQALTFFKMLSQSEDDLPKKKK